MRVPLDVHQALARQGLSGAEHQLVRAIEQRFYHQKNLDLAHKPKNAVPLSYGDFRMATCLGNGQIHDGVGSLEGQRVIEVQRRGQRAALYAIRPAEVWAAKPKRAPRGARTQRHRLRRLKLHRGGGAL